MPDAPVFSAGNPLNALLGGESLDADTTLRGLSAGNPITALVDPERHKREFEVPQYLQKMINSEVTWEQVAPRVKEAFGVDPEQYRQGYMLNEARAVQKGEGDSGIEWYMRNALPFGRHIRKFKEERDLGEAQRRFDAGEGTAQDAQRIARAERLHDLEKKRSTGESVFRELATIPSLLMEFGAGGRVVRGVGGMLPGAAGRTLTGTSLGARAAQGALTTPFVPIYLAKGQANQNANPNESLFQSYAPEVALEASQNAVLGTLQKYLSGAPITRLGRLAGKTFIGMGESAGADAATTALDRTTKAITGKSLGLDTKWGTLGAVLRGDEGSKKAAIVQFATFSVFSAMHTGRELKPEQLADAIAAAKDPQELVDTAQKVAGAVREGKDPAAPFEGKKGPIADLGRSYAEAVKSMMEPPKMPTEPIKIGPYTMEPVDLLDFAADNKINTSGSVQDVLARVQANRGAFDLLMRRLNAESRPRPTSPPAPEAPKQASLFDQAPKTPTEAPEGPIPEPARVPADGEIAPEPASPGLAVQKRGEFGDLKGRDEAIQATKDGIYVGMDTDNMAGLMKHAGEAGKEHVTEMMEIVREELGKAGQTRLFKAATDAMGDENGAVVSGADLPAVQAAIARAEARIREYAVLNGLMDLPRVSEKAGPRDVGVSMFAEPIKGRSPAVVEGEIGAGLETLKQRRAPRELTEEERAARDAKAEEQRRALDARLKGEQEAKSAKKAAAARLNLQRANLSRVSNTLTETAGEKSFAEGEAQAVVDGVRTFAKEIAGRLDPRTLSKGEIQLIMEETGAKDERAFLRLPFIKPLFTATNRRVETFKAMGESPTKKGEGLDTLAQELVNSGHLGEKAGIHADGDLLDAILTHRPIEASDKAYERMEAERIQRQMDEEAARLAELPPEEREAEAARMKAEMDRINNSKMEELFDTESEAERVAIQGEATFGEKLWAAADRLEKEAKAELKAFGEGEVPFSDFAALRMAGPIIKLAAAKIAKGTITFADFARSLIAKFGESVKPHLLELWDKAESRASLITRLEGAEKLAGRNRLIGRLRGAAPEEAPTVAGGTLGPKRKVRNPIDGFRIALSLGGLSEKEINALRYAAQGMSLRESAAKVGVSQEAMRKQLENVRDWLGFEKGELLPKGAEGPMLPGQKRGQHAKSELQEIIDKVVAEDALDNARRLGKGALAAERAARGLASKREVSEWNKEEIEAVTKALALAEKEQEALQNGYNEFIDSMIKEREKRRAQGEEVTWPEPVGGKAAAEPPANRPVEDGADGKGAAAEVRTQPDAAPAEGAERPTRPTDWVKGGIPAEAPRLKGFSLFDFISGEEGSFLFPAGRINDLFDSMSRALFGRQRVRDPNFQPDNDPNPNNAPALTNPKVAKRLAFNQIGANNATKQRVATTTWAWLRDQAENIARNFMIRFGTEKDHFAGMPDWQDRIEAEIAKPGSQGFTPEQLRQVDIWKSNWQKLLKALDAAGVKFYDQNGNRRKVADMLAEGYFHRGVVRDQSQLGQVFSLFKSGHTRKPGFKPGYRKQRNDATLAENEAAGVKYKNFWESTAEFIELANKEIADQWIANERSLGGRDLIAPKRAELLAEYKPQLDAMKQAGLHAEAADMERNLLKQARASAMGNVRIAPAFEKKWYPEESKQHLEAQFGERSGPILKVLSAMNQEARNLQLGMDASFSFLQLLPMAFSNPIRWAKTLASGAKGLFDGNVVAKIAASRPDFKEAANQWVQGGGSLNKPTEGVFSPGESTFSRLPGRLGRVVSTVYRNTYERAAQSMSQVLDIAKIELFLANRSKNPKDWPAQIEAIENSLGQGRMEKLGLSPERMFLERAVFLAPSFYRAYVGNFKAMFAPGAGGALARKQMGSLAAGVLTTSIGLLYAAKALGILSDEEMEERLNPERGKFLMVPIPVGDGKRMEVGFGGVYMSVVRTMGNAKRYAEGQTDENPATRWYRGHSGSLIRAGWDIGTGTDYLGQPTDTASVLGKMAIPLAAQQGITGEGNAAQRIGTTVAGALGLRSYAGAENTEYVDRLRRAAAVQYGKRYEDLTFEQQAKLVKQFAPSKPPATEAAKYQALQADQLRARRLTRSVSRDTRSRLEEVGRPSLPGYDPVLSIGGVQVPMGRARQAEYEAMLVEEYDRAVATWPVAKLKDMPTKAKEDWINKSLTAAKNRARSRLLAKK